MKTKYDVAIESLEELEKRLNNGKFLEAKDMFKYIWDRIERAEERANE